VETTLCEGSTLLITVIYGKAASDRHGSPKTETISQIQLIEPHLAAIEKTLGQVHLVQLQRAERQQKSVTKPHKPEALRKKTQKVSHETHETHETHDTSTYVTKNSEPNRA